MKLILRRIPAGRLAAPFAAIAWMATAALGFLALETYERTPGAAGRPPAGWPEGSSLGFVPGRPNLVMALHPRCPCSRASLALLGEIAGRAGVPSSPRLLVFRPEGSSLGCWDAVAPPSGAMTLVDDPGGREAARFGLATSGAVAAFDAEGRLRFSGGLTARRGLEAPSEGAEAVSAILAGRPPARGAAPAFGCGLGPSNRRAGPGRSDP